MFVTNTPYVIAILFNCACCRLTLLYCWAFMARCRFIMLGCASAEFVYKRSMLDERGSGASRFVAGTGRCRFFLPSEFGICGSL